MASYRIVAVHVEHPGTDESHISGVELAGGHRYSVSQIIEYMNQHTFYYTDVDTVARVVAVPASSYHRAYIKTHADDILRNNLLHLRRY